MNKSAPYTTKEKILLAQLVRENEVVENKRTDLASLEQKNRAWKLISKGFNSHPEVNIPRTSSQLKKLWSNLKQRKRKQHTEERTPRKPMSHSVFDFGEDAAPWGSTAILEKEIAEATKVAEHLISADPASPENDYFPSASIDTFMGRDKEKSKKTNLTQTVFTEKNARVQKMQEAIEQQRELHNLRRKIMEEEREFARKKAELELRRAEDEAQLAALKLAEYKRKTIN